MATDFNTTGYTTFKISSSTIGITDENGYNEDWQYFWDPIFTDQYGTQYPATQQYMGKILTLSGTLVHYDTAVLANIRAGGDGATNTLGTIGELFDSDSLYFALIAQDSAGGTRTYHRCRLLDSTENKGLKVSRFDFTIEVKDNGSGTFYTDA